MDEIVVNQTKYISSKRAAKLTGYAKDYVGQLVRMGKLEAQRVGRAWYVSESGILEHAGLIAPEHETDDASTTEPQQNAALSRDEISIAPRRVQSGIYTPSHPAGALPKTWSAVKYSEDDSDLFPLAQVNEKSDKVKIVSNIITDSRDLSTISDEFAANIVPEKSITLAETERISPVVVPATRIERVVVPTRTDGIRFESRNVPQEAQFDRSSHTAGELRATSRHWSLPVVSGWSMSVTFLMLLVFWLIPFFA